MQNAAISTDSQTDAKKRAEETAELERLKEAYLSGVDPQTGRPLTKREKQRVRRRIERLEKLLHRPKIEISPPVVVRVFPDDSWGFEAARPSFDPPTDPDPASGMSQRGLITFPGGIPSGGGGKILLRIDCQGSDMLAPFDTVHLTANWAGVSVNTGAHGPGVNPPDVFGNDFGKVINTFPDSALRQGLFFFQDGNPAKGIFLLLVDAVPTAAAPENFTVTATDTGGSDTQSVTIHQ